MRIGRAAEHFRHEEYSVADVNGYASKIREHAERIIESVNAIYSDVEVVAPLTLSHMNLDTKLRAAKATALEASELASELEQVAAEMPHVYVDEQGRYCWSGEEGEEQ